MAKGEQSPFVLNAVHTMLCSIVKSRYLEKISDTGSLIVGILPTDTNFLLPSISVEKNMRRQKSGFTLVELLVVIILIGILSAMGIANYIVARDRARTAGVRENMHTAQTAAEGYHTETTLYADVATKMNPFFPSGAFSVGGATGNRGNNPFTGVFNEALYTETFTDAAAINTARTTPPSGGPGVRGQVGYCMTSDGESYAICGLDGNGIRLPNSTNGTLVLSNQ